MSQSGLKIHFPLIEILPVTISLLFLAVLFLLNYFLLNLFLFLQKSGEGAKDPQPLPLRGPSSVVGFVFLF